MSSDPLLFKMNSPVMIHTRGSDYATHSCPCKIHIERERERERECVSMREIYDYFRKIAVSKCTLQMCVWLLFIWLRGHCLCQASF